jgi:tryptophan 2,3-dioxygenase
MTASICRHPPGFNRRDGFRGIAPLTSGALYALSAGVVEALQTIYQHPDQYWAAYKVSERLVDIEINFQSWRFHHMKTVERIIGANAGTGGTSGVKFLQRALDTMFFPELIEVRSKIG